MSAMSQRHVLGEAVFEVAFATEDEAFAQHEELGDLVRRRLLAVVDEVFDEVGGGKPIYRFDSIEIDLGELPRHGYQEEMAARLKRRLRALLLQRLPAEQAETGPGARVVSQQRQALEKIEYFLRHGRLPWNHGHDQIDSLAQLAREVLRVSGADFLAFLKKQSRAEAGVTRRLIAQFPDVVLLDIATRLALTQSNLIGALVEELGRVLSRHRPTPARAREIRQRVWSALLDGCLLADGPVPGAEALIATILTDMARPAAGRRPAGVGGTPLENFTAGIETLLHEDSAPSAYSDEAWDGGERLAAALRNGGAREIESAWRDALRHPPSALREILWRHAAGATLRARLADALSESLRVETLARLEPGGSDFMAAVIERAGWFEKVAGTTGDDLPGIRQRLWAFSLAYLVLERGAVFSDQAYLDSLIRQSAAHAGLSRQEAARRLRRASARDTASGPAAEGLARRFSELAAAPPAATPDQVARGRERSEALIRGYDLLDRVRDGLRGARSGDTDLFAAVVELAEGHPVPWSRFQRELQAARVFGLSDALLEAGSRAAGWQRLWAFTLGYLAMQRGAADFDKLVRQTAVEAGLSPREVVTRLQQALENDEAAAPPLAGLVRLRSRLDDVGRASGAAEAARGRTRGDDLLDYLRVGLRGSREGKTDLSATVAELAESHPEAWSRLHRELRSGGFAAADLGAGMTPDALRLLIKGQLVSRGMGERNGADACLAAIERRAIQSGDGTRYYRQVLLGLVLGQTLDFPDELQPRFETRRDAPASPSLEIRKKSFARPQAVSAVAAVETDAAESLVTALEQRAAAWHADASDKRDKAAILSAETGVAEVEALLAGLRRDETALQRFVAAQPEALLARLLYRLRGVEHHAIQSCADLLADACAFSDLGMEPARLHEAKWGFLFGEWLGQGLAFDPRGFVRQFASHLAKRARWPDERHFRFLLRQQLRLDLPHTRRPPASPASEAAGATASGMVEREPLAKESLSRERDLVLAVRAALDDRVAAVTPARPAQAARAPAPEEASGEAIYIDNAGLVLAAPYLPRLFAMLDLLDGPAFRDAAAARRAAQILQYLVDGGESVDEFRLVLNKILCGLPLDTPIEREPGFSDREKEAVAGLLNGMIEHWKGVGHTSVAGLRETFLLREGQLRLKDDAWHLLVAPKPFDMLLDSLPWSIAVIRHRWMDRVIHVEWR